MNVAPRPELERLETAIHGAVDHAELHGRGLDPESVLDFSANTNPFGPSPALRAALQNLRIEDYPDRTAIRLRESIARSLLVETGCVLPGNGVSELIWLVALAFLRPGDRVLIVGPTYSEYAHAATLMGATVCDFTAEEADDFRFSVAGFGAQLDALKPRMVFLANPNNPTGTAIAGEQVASLARRQPRTLFVIDEAYFGFARATRSVLADRLENVLVLRSLTKDHALAGLRLGYAVANADIIDCLGRVQPPWSVNAAAQAAGIATLADTGHLEASLRRLREAKEGLVAGLQQLGLRPQPSAVHFFLLPIGSGAAFREALLQRQILVRDCTSFGLPQFVRISPRQPDDNAQLLQAVCALLAGGSCHVFERDIAREVAHVR